MGGSMVSLCASLAVGVVPAALAQSVDPVVQEARVGFLRVIAPTGAARQAVYERVLLAAQIHVPLPGLPHDMLDRAVVTISLASRVRNDVEAWTSVAEGLIVLRLADVDKWPEEKLQRVLRHEMAHIGLARYLGFAESPRWLTEGYSEWAAGGISCEGEVRLHLYFRPGRVREGDASGVEPFGDIADPRLAYDAYASFFDFLESEQTGSINDGRFMANVRAYGLDRAVVRTFGVNLSTLERRWRRYASRRFAHALDAASPTCADALSAVF